jgi:hypothetical protein
VNGTKVTSCKGSQAVPAGLPLFKRFLARFCGQNKPHPLGGVLDFEVRRKGAEKRMISTYMPGFAFSAFFV